MTGRTGGAGTHVQAPWTGLARWGCSWQVHGNHSRSMKSRYLGRTPALPAGGAEQQLVVRAQGKSTGTGNTRLAAGPALPRPGSCSSHFAEGPTSPVAEPPLAATFPPFAAQTRDGERPPCRGLAVVATGEAMRPTPTAPQRPLRCRPRTHRGCVTARHPQDTRKQGRHCFPNTDPLTTKGPRSSRPTLTG